MDLNELFRRHQLALIAVRENQLSDARAAAAREADHCAQQINALRSAATCNRAVLSSRTFSALSGITAN